MDVKKLGRFDRPGHRVAGRGPGRHHPHKGLGWEAVHVCVDDTTRLAYVEILDNELAETSTGFLERAVAWLAGRGAIVERPISSRPTGKFVKSVQLE